MNPLRFEYEIPRDEYVAGQLLYYKAHGRKPYIKRGAIWFLAGAFCLATGLYSQRPEDGLSLSLFLLAGIGIWWMWAAIGFAFPASRFRRAYSSSEVVGRSYKANVDETGFTVAGKSYEWRVRWPAVEFKAEDQRVFIFYAANTVFILGKKFLSDEQQYKLRRLSGLQS